MTDTLHTEMRDEKRFASILGWLMLISLELLVLGQVVLAYRDHFLTVSQMQAAHVPRGLPLLWHFGIWGDFFIVSPVVAYLITRYSGQWRSQSVLLSLTIGFMSASLFGWLWTLSAIPEAHMHNHHLTDAGAFHLLYMAVVLTVLLEFFLFTPSVPSSDLRAISALLVFNLFLGTHMALGILKFFVGLDWYPGEPLKSTFGHLTILTIAIALLLRNLGLDLLVNNGRKAAHRLAQLLIWLMKKIVRTLYIRPETPYGLLKFLDTMGGKSLEVTYFTGSALKIFLQHGFIKSLLPGGLVFVIAAKFFLSRHSVGVELEIGERLFPQGKLPDDWTGLSSWVGITLSVIGYFTLYIALPWFTYNVIAASLVLFLIGCIDWNTRRLIHKNTRSLFVRHPLRMGDKDYETIKENRRVWNEYLFDKPHLWKEAACAGGCGLAFVVALMAHAFGSAWLRSLAYIIAIATLLTNEFVTWRWRSVRDRRLKEIEALRKGTAMQVSG